MAATADDGGRASVAATGADPPTATFYDPVAGPAPAAVKESCVEPPQKRSCAAETSTTSKLAPAVTVPPQELFAVHVPVHVQRDPSVAVAMLGGQTTIDQVRGHSIGKVFDEHSLTGP